jgi:hypothetical protein
MAIGGLHQRSRRLDSHRHAGRRPAVASGNDERRFPRGAGQLVGDSTRIAYHRSEPGNQFERFVNVVDVKTARAGRSSRLTASITIPSSLLMAHPRLPWTDIEIRRPHGRSAQRRYAIERFDAGRAERDGLLAGRRGQLSSRLDKEARPRDRWCRRRSIAEEASCARVDPRSGSDQNFLGWHPGSYRMYSSASTRAAGLRVLTRYRGVRLRRDWSTGVHMGLGVNDTADVAGGGYLKTLDYVDPNRIGVWPELWRLPDAAGDERRSHAVARGR